MDVARSLARRVASKNRLISKQGKIFSKPDRVLFTNSIPPGVESVRAGEKGRKRPEGRSHERTIQVCSESNTITFRAPARVRRAVSKIRNREQGKNRNGPESVVLNQLIESSPSPAGNLNSSNGAQSFLGPGTSDLDVGTLNSLRTLSELNAGDILGGTRRYTRCQPEMLWLG